MVQNYYLVNVLNPIEKKTMTFNDNTIKTEGLGNLFKNKKFQFKQLKKLTTNVMKSPARAL